MNCDTIKTGCLCNLPTAATGAHATLSRSRGLQIVLRAKELPCEVSIFADQCVFDV